jgi:hypothetical protein
MRRVGFWSLLALVALAIGCAEERPPINRVQAVALPKTFFLGPNLQDSADDPEFFMRGTVIDVGYGAAQDGLFTSTYAMPVSRIKWEITENHLNARLAYERVQGTDSKGQTYDGLRKKATNDGQVVATYRIISHFDIKRAYNPTTGEAMNIIEENTTDRPWYEREYFRVDWSQNLSTDTYEFDTLSMLGIYGGIQYEPIPYAVTDERHPDAPHFDLQQGYFDVTTKAFAKPLTIDLSSPGLGDRQVPRLLAPRGVRGRDVPLRKLQPGGAHLALLVPQGRGHRLRASPLGRVPLPGLRYLHQRLPGLRAELRNAGREVVSLCFSLQPLGAQPLLPRHGKDGGGGSLQPL